MMVIPIRSRYQGVVEAAVPRRPPVAAGASARIPWTIAAANDGTVDDARPTITGSTGAIVGSNNVAGPELLATSTLTGSNAVARAKLLTAAILAGSNNVARAKLLATATLPGANARTGLKLLAATSGSWPITDRGNIAGSRPTGAWAIGTCDLSRQRRTSRWLLNSAESRTLSGPLSHTLATTKARPRCRTRFTGRLYLWTIRHTGPLSTRADAAGTCSNVRLRGPRHACARLAKATHGWATLKALIRTCAHLRALRADA
jgi:hypothetical protein